MTIKPLLIFDSGVGGLSVLAHIRAHLPHEAIVYCADNAGFPYGLKSDAELADRVPALLARLCARYRPELVVIACNTASTIALGPVRTALGLPVVGTVPAIKPAAACTRTKVIGLLGTHATVRRHYVDTLINEFASDCCVLRHGSARLVEAAEAKLRGEALVPELISAELDGLFSQPEGKSIDTVVLACTHFPLLAAELAVAVPHPVTWIDSGEGIARRVVHLLGDRPQNGQQPGRMVFTGVNPQSSALASALARYGLTEIEYL